MLKLDAANREVVSMLSENFFSLYLPVLPCLSQPINSKVTDHYGVGFFIMRVGRPSRPATGRGV